VVATVALPSVDYAPRDPAADVLHRVVREHLQTFLAEAAHLRDAEGVPRFVEDEFQAFLSCGWLAGGFARFRCVGCQTERLVAFSCKGRGFCPSRGPRRTDCVRWGWKLRWTANDRARRALGGPRHPGRTGPTVRGPARGLCALGWSGC
jgi:Transposase zinc-binding domain